MRIHELAKSIGQRFSADVKSVDLIEEINSNDAFAEIRDKIKSHSSSVGDKHAALMFQIFEARVGGGASSGPSGGAQRPAAPKPQARPAVPPRPAPRPAPSAAPPRPQPIRPGGAVPPPITPLRSGPPRPKPLGQPARTPGVVPPPRPVAPRSAAPAAATPPAPEAPAAAEPAVKAAPVEKKSAPKAAPEAKPAPKAAAAPEAKAKPAPSAAPGRPEKPSRQKQRPALPPRLGQPAAPKMPKFSTDSPFLNKPKPAPRPQESGRGGERGGSRREGPSKRDSKPVNLDNVTKLPEIGVMKLKGGGGKRHREDKAEREKRLKGEKLQARKKTLRPTRVYGDADEFRRPLRAAAAKQQQQQPQKPKEKGPQPIEGPVILTEPLTVAEFAEKIGLTAGELIKTAFMKGKAITINQLIDFELAEELAFDRDIDLRVELAGDETDVAEFRNDDKEEDLVSRPPVVTIMGHVDHGKTTVLDHYRNSNVVDGEHGGITQHIGAYHVSSSRGDIVFLDTPGHAAFTAMRARGAQSTDIVVLVVAADDSVMPQTVEAINHAKAAGVPLIVAINKCDTPAADPAKVRNELMQYGVLATQLGGDVEFAEISAKLGQGMEELLEIISLQAEVMELKGNPNCRAEGVVIESHVDSLRGSVATVLIQRGTLHQSDIFVVGQQTGRVRAMRNDRGVQIKESMLCQPIEVIGLTGTPEVGELFLVMENERKAREIAEIRESRRRLLELGTTRHVSIEGLQEHVEDSDVKECNVILKADVQGSVEAIAQALEKLNTTEVRVRILHSATGGITESDVSLAQASGATIIGFCIRPEAGVGEMAEHEGVTVKLYSIIYELLEDMEASMLGLHEKRFKEVQLSRVEVREIFKVSRVGSIAGCMVLSGEIGRNDKVRLVRDNVEVYKGKIFSLRRVKDDVAKVASGFECGIMLERFQDIKRGDIIESYTMEELPVEVTRLEQTSKQSG